MFGYCSNSPLRCENARSTKVLRQIDSCCPECHLFLLPTQNITQQLHVEEKFLRLVFMIVATILLIAVCIYFLNFV